MDLHRSGWGWWCLTWSFCLSCCMCVCVWDIHETNSCHRCELWARPDTPTTSPPPPFLAVRRPSSVSAFQRETIKKCKPVAPPEAADPPCHCSVDLFTRETQRRKARTFHKTDLDVCDLSLLYPPLPPASMRLATALVCNTVEQNQQGSSAHLTAWFRNGWQNSYTHWMYCITVFKDRRS